ncbi:MAG: hypothetical protein HXY49_05500 [Ignavibacteriaceae bacterium]|nr:hypothetical protein [Ignavibacteriaceae bacterium]
MKNALLAVFFIILTSRAICQQNELSEFLFGSFVASSDSIAYTVYNNYEQISSMGLNSVFQKARRYIPGSLGWEENLTQLNQFTYVYPANTIADWPSLYNGEPEKIDWIYNFSNAMYSKWEAEGDDELFNQNVRIKNTNGQIYLDQDGTKGIKSTVSSQAGDSLIFGPHYYQYPVYVFGYASMCVPIEYIANFRLKRGYTQQSESTPLCTLQVIRGKQTARQVGGNWVIDWEEEELLEEKIVTIGELSVNEYGVISINYKHAESAEELINNPNYPDTSLMPQGRLDVPECLLAGSCVKYQVIWSGSAELFVDHVEVFDSLFWKN